MLVADRDRHARPPSPCAAGAAARRDARRLSVSASSRRILSLRRELGLLGEHARPGPTRRALVASERGRRRADSPSCTKMFSSSRDRRLGSARRAAARRPTRECSRSVCPASRSLSTTRDLGHRVVGDASRATSTNTVRTTPPSSVSTSSSRSLADANQLEAPQHARVEPRTERDAELLREHAEALRGAAQDRLDRGAAGRDLLARAARARRRRWRRRRFSSEST